MTKQLEHKVNRGSLWKNKNIRDDKDPVYTGSANIAGIGEVWLNAWVEETKAGQKYFAIAIKPKQKPDTSKPLREEMEGDMVPF